MRIGQPPPLPLNELRPSQADNILFSWSSTYIASTQPVSRSVLEPLPQTSSDPVKVTLPLAFWHLIVVWLGSVIEKLLPEPLVGIVTGLPSYAELPVPSMTCSLVESTRPVRA